MRKHRKSCHINFLQERLRLRKFFPEIENSEDGDHAGNRFYFKLKCAFFNVDCFVLQCQDVPKIECELIKV